MIQGHAIALIAAPSSLKSSSLRTFLGSIIKTHITFEAYSLAETIQVLKNRTIDLIVFDVDLSGEDLTACLQELRALKPQIHWIVLVNTAAQRQLAFDMGANYALLKNY